MNLCKHPTSLKIALLLTAALLAWNPSEAEGLPAYKVAVRDRLEPLPAGAVTLGGSVGHKLDQCITNRILLQELHPMLDLFLTRTNDTGGFKGEFLGKWLTAAALSCRYRENPPLQARVDGALEQLTQGASLEGYLTTYPPGAEFQTWDVWIQKYVLLGLLAEYDQTGKRAALEAAKRSADYVLGRNGPGKLSIEEYGPPNHKGGCNFSILEPMVLLYERTGEKRYLDFAKYIVAAWSQPGKYTPRGVRLIEQAEAGTPLVESEVLHAYASMSCFEGLCELYRATGKQRYLEACLKFAQLIQRDELMITGSASNHEMWYNGALEQTEMLERPVETCATATWLKLCYQLLRLTGDSKWADRMEVSLFNSLLGAMMPQGEWWAYDSPLTGERVPSRQQGAHLSCCVSSGPRGLLLTPEWAVMKSTAGGPVVNLYSPGTTWFKLPNGRNLKLVQETGYPATSQVTLTLQPEEPASFVLKLRIPEWSKQTTLRINGQLRECKPGAYASIERHWKANDKVSLEFDLRGRILRAPSGAPQQAVMRGPIVLAFDNRLTPPEDTTVWLLPQPLVWEDVLSPYLLAQPRANTNAIRAQMPKGYVLQKHNYPKDGEPAYVDLVPAKSKPDDVWMAFEVPFLVRPSHFLNHHTKNLVMCDYASAGNRWSQTNLFRVWAPQPMFMGNMYPSNTWKIMLGGARRTTVPDYIQEALSRSHASSSAQ
jgi:uncharacterized protein